MYPCNVASWSILEGVSTLETLHPGTYWRGCVPLQRCILEHIGEGMYPHNAATWSILDGVVDEIHYTIIRAAPYPTIIGAAPYPTIIW